MKLKLYFDQDKIIGQGSIIISIDDDLPKEAYTGVDIIREYDNAQYEISLNRYIEQKVLTIYNEARPGARGKIYKLIGTRELVAYDLLFERLVIANEPVNEPVNYYFLWKEINARGVYFQTCASNDIILDKAVHDDVLEYDNNGYYSVAYSFVERIKQKKSYAVKDAMALIQCPDDIVTMRFFENIGYTWKKGKLVLGKDIDNLFDQ